MSKVISFTLNGTAVEVTDRGDTPLLFVLRNQLDQKGTRLGCGEGQCGACTIIVDGVAQTSCNLPVEAVAGKSVGTVEDVLASDHPLIEALLRHQAGQCGYCLPGIITKAARLIDRGLGVDDIRTALDENLCRCGAHNRIMAAIAEVKS